MRREPNLAAFPTRARSSARRAVFVVAVLLAATPWTAFALTQITSPGVGVIS